MQRGEKFGMKPEKWSGCCDLKAKESSNGWYPLVAHVQLCSPPSAAGSQPAGRPFLSALFSFALFPDIISEYSTERLIFIKILDARPFPPLSCYIFSPSSFGLLFLLILFLFSSSLWPAVLLPFSFNG